MFLEKTQSRNSTSDLSDSKIRLKGNLPEFIDKATRDSGHEQIYVNVNFLAIIYTHPYRKYDEYHRPTKKCKLWVIYIDLEMYNMACDEL